MHLWYRSRGHISTVAVVIFAAVPVFFLIQDLG